MPGLHPCATPRCPTLVRAGHCPAHQRNDAQHGWQTAHGENVKRVRGSRLQKLRKQLFAKQPLCVLCLQMHPPRVKASVIRDHIVPLAEGGQDVVENTQGLCAECSDAKTKQESQRGRVSATQSMG
jgi:5-methylcytosine-specific restriction protein A